MFGFLKHHYMKMIGSYPTIEKLKAAGYTYEEEGALWFKSTEFGDDKDRVLIKVMDRIHI